MFMQWAKDTGCSDTSCELDKRSKPPWSEQKRLGNLLTENIYIHREIMHSCNFIGLHMQGC